MSKKITLSVCIFLFNLILFAQGKSDYENDSRWFWGLNLGTTWHTTDVKYKTDWGYGFTLGKSFNYDYGRAISFDIRGRYLYGEWYGQNTSKTDFTMLNNTLSSGLTNYKDSLGFSVLNFKTTNYRVALELVLHANAFRDRTGWDFYVFGGLGITGYKSKGDLLDAQGNMYQYDSLPDLSKGTLKGVLDGTYETDLDGSATSNVEFMPSLGIGIGYQIGKRFSMGLEHKTTFTRADHFDGYNNATGSRENDLYHYTGAYLRFHVKSRKTTFTNNDPVDPVKPPKVTFTNPASSGTTVTRPNYTIRALVQDVKGKENINFRQNGVYKGEFTYNPTTDRMECPVILQAGQNTFEIIASNAYGSDEARTVLILEQPKQPAPIVNITNPGSNPYSAATRTFDFAASILNLTQVNQASVQVNGASVTNFNFDPRTGQLSLPLNLNLGSNVVTVTGTNETGTDSKTTNIIYDPRANLQAPEVYFIDPARSPYQTSVANYNLRAQVRHITGSADLTFKQNGRVNQNFIYDTQTNTFSSQVVLGPGQNVFELIARNSAGEADATSILIYDYAAPKPPVVTITNPNTTPFTTGNNIFPLRARVLNVTSRAQISMNLNGVVQNQFQYEANTMDVSCLLNLVEGNNVLVLTATNSDGSDSKQTHLIYRKPAQEQPPVVNFINPSSNPYQTENPNARLAATVLNVVDKAAIRVNINGTDLSNFTFNASEKFIAFNSSLIEGANIVSVTASNGAGSDSKTTTLIYRKQKAVNPPVISYIDPVENPKTVFNAVYPLRAQVQYVDSKNQIQLRVNGQASTAFNYNEASDVLEFSTGLIPGANIVEIVANNSGGTTSKSTTIIYKKSEPLLAPVVQIVTPVANPYTVRSANTTIKATVLNISSEKYIQVYVNNLEVKSFDYQPTSHLLSLIMPLNEGNNTIVIRAKNATGQSEDQRTIIYKNDVVVSPPMVSFINPSSSGITVQMNNYSLKASVLNIESEDQIEVKQNGRTINSSLYNFNRSSRELVFNTGLSLGNNVFTIQGTNSAGTRGATTMIIYKQNEVPCAKPEIVFASPTRSGVEVKEDKGVVKVTTKNLGALDKIKLLINGVQVRGSFNPKSQQFIANVTYALGQNVLEVIGENACDEVKVSTIVVYKPQGKPCEPPSLQLIEPLRGNITVAESSYEVRIGVLNIEKQEQLTFNVNGQQKRVNLDQSTHLLITSVDLREGENKIEVLASNDCGSARIPITITRNSCQAPKISMGRTSVSNNSETFAENVELKGTTTGLSKNTEFKVSLNGREIGHVFNVSQQSFSISSELQLGMNRFELTATNACGKEQLVFQVKRNAIEVVNPPVVRITNPGRSPFNTEAPTFNIQATTEFVTAANQVVMTVNGQAVNPNFNVKNGSLNYNLSLKEGNNIVRVTVATKGGTASDTKTIVYVKAVKLDKPKIVLTNPTSCPAILAAGEHVITGYVLNITNPSEVTMQLNNVAFTNFNPVMANGRMNFHFTINISEGNNNVNVIIKARTAGGNDTHPCEMRMKPGSGKRNNPTEDTKGGTVIPDIKLNKGNNSGGGKTPPPTPTPTPTPRRGGGK